MTVIYTEHMLKKKNMLENFLQQCFLDTSIPQNLSTAMRYSLLAGGKRLRPILCLSSFVLCSEKKEENILPFAAALEMIHTYSLIHDDLPCMDNDDLRRGKPTSHKAFSESTALLAGDALLTDAFYMMTLSNISNSSQDSPTFHNDNLLQAISLVAQASGSQGMVGGQILDLAAENKNISFKELKELNAKKTGALLCVSCDAGAMLAGADTSMQKALHSYGQSLGIAFQIVDDILDIEGDVNILGKNIGMDTKLDKATWPKLFGLEQSKKEAYARCEQAASALEHVDFPSLIEKQFLQELAIKMSDRIQ